MLFFYLLRFFTIHGLLFSSALLLAESFESSGPLFSVEESLQDLKNNNELIYAHHKSLTNKKLKPKNYSNYRQVTELCFS